MSFLSSFSRHNSWRHRCVTVAVGTSSCLADHHSPALVQQNSLQFPTLWVDAAAVDAGVGMLQVAYRMGGQPCHCPLPLKPLKLQPARRAAGASGLPTAETRSALAAKAIVSSKTHMQVYRLVAGLFPKLARLHGELTSDTRVQLELPGAPVLGLPPPGAVRATPSATGVLLEGLMTDGETRLSISINWNHACLELHSTSCSSGSGSGSGSTGASTCLRTVNCLEEALMTLRGEAGPAPAGLSPLKPSGSSQHGSPSKPPLRPASGLESLQMGVELVQACTCAQLREGVALLSAAAGSTQLTTACLNLGAVEALVTAAATVVPSSMMGTTELLTSLVLALTALLESASPGTYAAGRLISILAAALAQACANPLLLCQLMVALLQRPDVRAEAMRHGLASAIADMYLRKSTSLEAAMRTHQLSSAPPEALAAASCVGTQVAAGTCVFGPPLTAGHATPLLPGGAGPDGQVARLVAAFNSLGGNDSGSDCSPCSSKSPSRVREGEGQSCR